MLQGKIVDIIDNRTVAINLGSEDRVKNGMLFQVYEDEGKTIHDPETKEVLGKIKIPKIKVKVTYIDDKFSLAETFEYELVNVGGINTFASTTNIFSPPRYVKKYKTFDIENEQKVKIEEEKSTVKLGDYVEQIKETTS